MVISSVTEDNEEEDGDNGEELGGLFRVSQPASECKETHTAAAVAGSLPPPPPPLPVSPSSPSLPASLGTSPAPRGFQQPLHPPSAWPLALHNCPLQQQPASMKA